MTTATPPLPPDVTSQQASPAQQFAQNAAAQPGAGAGVGQGPQASMQFVGQQLQIIADAMGKVVQTLAVEKPAVVPLLTRAAGILKFVEKQVQESSQGQGAPQPQGSEPPPQAAMSQGEGPESLGM